MMSVNTSGGHEDPGPLYFVRYGVGNPKGIRMLANVRELWIQVDPARLDLGSYYHEDPTARHEDPRIYDDIGPEDPAAMITDPVMRDLTGHDPNAIWCHCCGPNYSRTIEQTDPAGRLILWRFLAYSPAETIARQTWIPAEGDPMDQWAAATIADYSQIRRAVFVLLDGSYVFSPQSGITARIHERPQLQPATR